jgi:hypothetical protein
LYAAFEKTKLNIYTVNTKTGSVENIPIALDLPVEFHLAKIQMRSQYQEEVIQA